MPRQISIYLQHIVPQHLLTAAMGRLAQIQLPWLKNWMINRFIRKYHVDMSAAVIETPEAYPDFNSFFIRQLKPELRPIVTGQQDIASPVDGIIAQIGTIAKNQLFQAKQYYYNLESLLGGDTHLANLFYDGSFATIYLAPRDYHRIHMPLAGKLTQSIYIPGKLFSVNRMTSEIIPELYSRNERLVTIFDTAAGPMAVILVGAMIVGNIQTVWMKHAVKSASMKTDRFDSGIQLDIGAEIGHFKLGSTVILLFGKDAMKWASPSKLNTPLKFGQLLGKILI
jgi:phosphatidylserine decarboxylase